MILYRYIDTAHFVKTNDGFDFEKYDGLILIEYEVIKETAKGYRIKLHSASSEKGMGLWKTEGRRKYIRKYTLKGESYGIYCYAHLTKKEAWEAYVKIKIREKATLILKLDLVRADLLLATKTKRT